MKDEHMATTPAELSIMIGNLSNQMSDLKTTVKDISETTTEILVHATKTNGRVNSLEDNQQKLVDNIAELTIAVSSLNKSRDRVAGVLWAFSAIGIFVISIVYFSFHSMEENLKNSITTQVLSGLNDHYEIKINN